MNATLLFPHSYRKFGVYLCGIAVIFIIFMFLDSKSNWLEANVYAIYNSELMKPPTYFTIINNNILDELAGIFSIAGLLLLAFTKEKSEDEFIRKIRLESLLWATYINYIILAIMMIFIYGFGFLYIMMANILKTLILFNIKYYRSMNKLNRALDDE